LNGDQATSVGSYDA